MKRITRYALFLVMLFVSAVCDACGRMASDNSHILVLPAAQGQTRSIGMSRKDILESMTFTASPEAKGCWSGATGNFDKTLLSVGVAQWNFGSGSLQPLLRRFKLAYRNDAEFISARNQLMPVYGKMFFSQGCLSRKVTAECENFILGAQSGSVLRDDFRAEVDKLFESDVMTQIQADTYVSLLTSVVSDLKRVFPNRQPSDLQVKWAIDTKVQQGGFPGDENLVRIREKIKAASSESIRKYLLGMITWYEGMATSIDQDGIRLDYKTNVTIWKRLVQLGLEPDQVEMLAFTYLRSRVASKQSGLYQADTFQRRASIIFGIGSVHGNFSGEDRLRSAGLADVRTERPKRDSAR